MKPILFSSPMIRAILSGGKTTTRRIMKPQVKPCDHQYSNWKETLWSEVGLQEGLAYCTLCGNGVTAKGDGIKSPYGKPGDTLWCRESYTILEPEHCNGFSDRFLYKADMKDRYSEELRKEYIAIGYPYQWKPSIHMPKAACRIYLKITGLRIERLQSISNEDAKAEGVDGVEWNSSDYGGPPDYVTPFQQLWKKLNGEDSWHKNPWVWVLNFERII